MAFTGNSVALLVCSCLAVFGIWTKTVILIKPILFYMVTLTIYILVVVIETIFEVRTKTWIFQLLQLPGHEKLGEDVNSFIILLEVVLLALSCIVYQAIEEIQPHQKKAEKSTIIIKC
ncbi:hypothetical protein L596_020895 [Steinernema carpocapsae]|uniref:Uncharacterized protein n=1 Tax=Steinernema carpocapsae TaxID=34508 RepID=A0A4U5MV25_STECR|nr:hypothetical protein L596_020895 [Steinernema carpocapsae]